MRERDRREARLTPKLADIKEKLHANPKLFYAGNIVLNFVDRDGVPLHAPRVQTVDIIVAPKRAKFDPKRLNRFMHGLLGDGEPTMSQDSKYEGSFTGLHLGNMTFDENLGVWAYTADQDITTHDEEQIREAGLAVGTKHIHKSVALERRTWVRVYPDPVSVQIVYTDMFETYQKMHGDAETVSRHEPPMQFWINPVELIILSKSQDMDPRRVAKMIKLASEKYGPTELAELADASRNVAKAADEIITQIAA